MTTDRTLISYYHGRSLQTVSASHSLAEKQEIIKLSDQIIESLRLPNNVDNTMGPKNGTYQISCSHQIAN